ncbi:MAG: hypothetical protein ACRDQ7_24180 [Haloechinothrix sp.]
MDYKTHVFDRYNWDGGKSTEIGPITITDDQMADLHRAGVAQEYNISGSSEAKHYSGTVPPPEKQPNLPVSCSFGPEQEERMPYPNANSVTTDKATVSEALSFGGIVLPPGARVLGVQSNKSMDQLHRVVVEVEPAAVDTLLSGSGFTTPLKPGRQVFMSPVDGFTPGSATKIASAQDNISPEANRKQTVTREVLVDRNDPLKVRVFLWLFTT